MWNNTKIIRKWLLFCTRYPLPVFSGIGIVCGIFCYFMWPTLLLWPAMSLAHFIFLVIILSCGAPLIWNTLKNMLHGQFAVDIIALLAIVTALAMNEYFAGAIIVFMQSSGESLEKFGINRAMFSLNALLSRAPKVAIRVENNQPVTISVQDIQVGDQILLKSGDLVPVDGTIIEGEGEIDASAITGEPFSQFLTVTGKILSGSILQNGALVFRADKKSADSQYEKIVQLVQEAQQKKAPIQRLADRYALFFTPLTLIMAGIGYLVTQDLKTILDVLVVATPCPLILATPIAVISAINRAAKKGIIVKGGAPLESIAKTQVAVFDKTGTLTAGVPHIEKITTVGPHTEEQVLFMAGIVEQFSSHAIANAITAAALEKFNNLPHPTHIQETPGRGIQGIYEGDSIAVGSAAYMQASATENKLQALVAVNGKTIGTIMFEDTPRPGASNMLARLKDLGVAQCAMLTGDNASNANRIAQSIGITTVYANLLPEDKLNIIQKLSQAHPHILMVGDGINDAPALATADIGMAMGAHGTAVSAEAADIVLLEDDIEKVALTVEIGQRMLHIAHQSILIGIGLSFILMIIAANGYIPAPVGAVLQEIIDVAVILNALRARQ